MRLTELVRLLNRWPRRLAVVALLLLAGSSALTAHRPAGAEPAAGDPVLVSARTLAAGATIAARDIAVARWPAGVAPAQHLRSAAGVIGRRLAAPVTPGEPITPARLVGAELTTGLRAGVVASSVPVAPQVAGFVHPGDRIDLLAPPKRTDASATVTAGADGGPATLVARGVEVLAVLPLDQPAPDAVAAALVIGTDRPTALRLAGLQDRQLLAVVSDPP